MNGPDAIHQFVLPILASMAALGGLICAALIAWSGLNYITASGNPEKMQRAKRTLIRSLIGLSIIMSAAAISAIIVHAYGSHQAKTVSSLPQLSNIKTSSDSGGLVDVLIKSISGLMVDVIKTAATPFIDALSYFTKSTPLLVNNSSVMHLWLISTGIADSLLTLVIALIGFHVMGGEQLGLREVNLRSLLPQIIFAFVIINTSIYLLDGVIELSNTMINVIRAGTGGITPWLSLEKIVAGASAFSLAGLAIFVVFLVFSVILIIYYLGRLVTLYLGAVLAPLVILMWLVPGFRDFAENALKAYLATIFVLFIHVIILSLAASLFLAVGGTGNSLMSLLLGLATLVALIKTQGVLMQLNYSTLGPKTARQLGVSFVGGMSYLAASTRYGMANVAAPLMQTAGNAASRLIPDTRPQLAKTAAPTTLKNNSAKSKEKK